MDEKRIDKLENYLDYLVKTHDFVPTDIVEAIKDRIELIKKGEV